MLFAVISCSTRSDFEIRNDKMSSLIQTGSDSISAHAHFPDKDVRKYLHNEFNEFYKSRNYDLAWLEFHEPQKQADELLETIDEASKHGLNPEDYNLDKIESLLSKLYDIDSKKERRKRWRKEVIKTKEDKIRVQEQDTARFNNIAQLDFLLTASYLTYASHLLSGRIDPNVEKEWHASINKKDLSEYLKTAIDKNQIKESLEDLAPSHEQYENLQDYLIHFQKGKDAEVPEVGRTLQSGDTGKNVLFAKKRLSYWKDISIDLNDSSTYNDEMARAVSQFQSIHEIKTTGKVDEQTRQLLNQPVSHWIARIETNMERMRWLPRDGFNGEYVLINIPAYELRVMNEDQEKMKMKIIVGTEYNRTPVFSDTLEYVVFNPTWTVPNSIATEEMLPAIKEAENPEEYFSKRNYKLYDSWDRDAEPIDPGEVDWSEIDSADWSFRIVESPNPNNALGRIKFMMPNDQAIYLHDTPADHLFSKQDRTFSHGCIRLEKPYDFAEYLLDLDRDKILKKIRKEETENVLLEDKLSVHIVYWSAWVNDEGVISFPQDIYNYDNRHIRKIKQKESEITP